MSKLKEINPKNPLFERLEEAAESELFRAVNDLIDGAKLEDHALGRRFRHKFTRAELDALAQLNAELQRRAANNLFEEAGLRWHAVLTLLPIVVDSLEKYRNN